LNLGPPQYEVRKPPIGLATVSSDEMANKQTAALTAKVPHPVLLVIVTNHSEHSGNYIYHLPQRNKFYAVPPHSVFMFPLISQKTSATTLKLIYWLAFVMETDCVLCAVRTEFIHLV
jgi:hypothetical protein